MFPIPLVTETLVKLHEISPDSPIYSSVSPSTIKAFASAQSAQTTHRINVIESLGGIDLFQDKRILEIGCGQGDASVVLTAAVSGGKGNGRVVAWDPASPDYGSPLTVGQAQANILSKQEVKPYLTFHLDQPLTDVFGAPYDIAVLLHCIYYFPDPSVLLDTLEQLHDNSIDKLCIAEYALKAPKQDQQPHVLAVLAEQALELFKNGEGSGNVQCVLSPKEITRIAAEAGWKVEKEEVITPDFRLQDGHWEVGNVCAPAWVEEVDKTLAKLGRDTKREKGWLTAARDAVLEAKDVLIRQEIMGGVGNVSNRATTMDVWCAVFVRAQCA